MTKKLETSYGTVVYDDNGHTYTLDGKVLNSTSDIIGIIDKSGPLMGWAVNQTKKGMKDKFRERFDPETIRLLSDLEDKEITRRLEDEINTISEYAGKERWRTSNKAKNIGSEVHRWIEGHIKGCMGGEGYNDYDLPQDEEVMEAVVEFCQWERNKVDKWLASEQICLIPTDNLLVGGTFDAIAVLNDGSVIVVDFKTSSGIYETHILQLSGYYHGSHETTDFSPDGICVLQCPKDDSEFDEKLITDEEELEHHVQGFLSTANAFYWRDNCNV